jgi:hypothetical protein
MAMSKYNLRVRQNINYNEDLYFDELFKNVRETKQNKKSKKQKTKETLVNELKTCLARNEILVGHDRLINVLDAIDTAVLLTKYYKMPPRFIFVVRNKIQEFLKENVSEDVSKMLRGYLNQMN